MSTNNNTNRTIAMKLGKEKIPQDRSKIPPNIDEYITIFSPKLPDVIKSSVSIVNELLNNDNYDLDHIIATIYEDILSNYQSITYNNLINLQKILKCNELKEKFSIIYTALYLIIHTSLRNRFPISKIKEDLLLYNYPSNVVTRMINAILVARDNNTLVNNNYSIVWPTVSKLKWRIDVIISTGSLTRVIRPNIIMQIILSDGRIKTFDVSIDQFNQLRYAVAKLLYDIQSLERHPIMRIIKEFKIKEIEDQNK